MKKIPLILFGVFLAAAFALLGCVPRSRLKREYEEGRRAGQIETVRGCADIVYNLRGQIETNETQLSRLTALLKEANENLSWEDDSDSWKSGSKEPWKP